MKRGFIKRLSAVVLAAVMAISLVPVMGIMTNGTVGQVEARAETSGTCGEKLDWTLDDEGTLTISGSGDMYSYDYIEEVPWYNERTSIINVQINEGVRSIGNYGFYDCVNLENVSFPSSLRTIGFAAFVNCSSLTELTIPDGVTDIDISAFQECRSLSNVTIPDGMTSIKSATFYFCTSLKKITIPDTVKSIGSSAFYRCDSLTEINIPDSVTSIEAAAFYESGLTSITIPDSVTSIGSTAFSGCNSLKDVTLSKNITKIESNTFYDCQELASITIPYGVTSIESGAFRLCSDLNVAIIPKTVISIGNNAFSGCHNLIVYYCGTEELWYSLGLNTEDIGISNIVFEYQDDSDVPYRVDANCPTPMQLFAMERLCYEEPDRYIMHNGKTMNLKGMKIDTLVDDSNGYDWFGDTSLADHNNSLSGLRRRDLYEQELLGWQIADIYRDDTTGFYAIVMKDDNNNRSVFVASGSGPLDSEALWSDWIQNNFPLYITQKLGAQPNVASKYFEKYKETYGSGDIYLTGHSLGASLAIYLSNRYDVDAITFDATPMLDASYYDRPYQMGDNFKGVDKWQFVDYVNKGDYLAGLWEIEYKNAVICKNYISDKDDFQNHSMEAMLTIDSDTDMICLKKESINAVKGVTEKYMAEQILGKTGISLELSDSDDLDLPLSIPKDTSRIEKMDESALSRSLLSLLNHLRKVNAKVPRNLYLEWGTSSAEIITGVKWNAAVLYGGDGDDVLISSDDADKYIGGRGNDSTWSDGGDDIYLYYKGHGKDIIYDSGGKDELRIYGYSSGTSLEIEDGKYDSTVGEKYIGIFVAEENEKQPELICKISKNRTRNLTQKLMGLNSFTISLRDKDDKVIGRRNISIETADGWVGRTIIKIQCPVELDIYRTDTNEIVSHIDDMPYEDGYEIIMDKGKEIAEVMKLPEVDENGELSGHYIKQIIFRDPSNYQIKIAGTETGAMDCEYIWEEDGVIKQAVTEQLIEYGSEYSVVFDATGRPSMKDEDNQSVELEEQAEYVLQLLKENGELAEPEMHLALGESMTIKAGDNADDIIWDTSNPDIVAIEEDGNNVIVKAITDGSSEVTAATADGKQKAYITILSGDEESSWTYPKETIDISKAVVTVDSAMYSGEELTPIVSVSLDDTILSEGTDYTVKYVNNINVGTATVIILGKWKYAGMLAKDFRIQFTDVLIGHQFFDPIYWAVDNNITTGWDDGTFRPWNTCNRAAVVTFLWRMAGKPEPTKIAGFKDMPADTAANQDFRKAISWAVEQGITTGWSDNTFRPWNTCNRAAIMTFIWRYADKPSATKPSSFKDKTGTADFDAAIAWASEKGISTGYDDGTFGPWRDCNRASVAAFLYRYEKTNR